MLPPLLPPDEPLPELRKQAEENLRKAAQAHREQPSEKTLMEVSRSLQHTLYAMGEAILKNFDPIREIRLSLPNQHYNLVDLSPFGLTNENAIFLPIDEPHGLIEATLKKS